MMKPIEGKQNQGHKEVLDHQEEEARSASPPPLGWT